MAINVIGKVVYQAGGINQLHSGRFTYFPVVSRSGDYNIDTSYLIKRFGNDGFNIQKYVGTIDNNLLFEDILFHRRNYYNCILIFDYQEQIQKFLMCISNADRFESQIKLDNIQIFNTRDYHNRGMVVNCRYLYCQSKYGRYVKDMWDCLTECGFYDIYQLFSKERTLNGFFMAIDYISEQILEVYEDLCYCGTDKFVYNMEFGCMDITMQGKTCKLCKTKVSPMLFVCKAFRKYLHRFGDVKFKDGFTFKRSNGLFGQNPMTSNDSFIYLWKKFSISTQFVRTSLRINFGMDYSLYRGLWGGKDGNDEEKDSSEYNRQILTVKGKKLCNDMFLQIVRICSIGLRSIFSFFECLADYEYYSGKIDSRFPDCLTYTHGSSLMACLKRNKLYFSPGMNYDGSEILRYEKFSLTRREVGRDVMIRFLQVDGNFSSMKSCELNLLHYFNGSRKYRIRSKDLQMMKFKRGFSPDISFKYSFDALKLPKIIGSIYINLFELCSWEDIVDRIGVHTSIFVDHYSSKDKFPYDISINCDPSYNLKKVRANGVCTYKHLLIVLKKIQEQKIKKMKKKIRDGYVASNKKKNAMSSGLLGMHYSNN